ncbi:CPBP family intramembrane metalloprotease [Salegentibacter sp. LM13S]|uniref:CPBP family intramembrane glutamic endopeptidase n=1 Tax=Salegentibacter lacus TaxID=2873599 RepID=UPI001CCEB111|nr:type II CAAX endopeptidase family protein [Salegentibacter lacus]MBZ9629750.1 CPBP family intramembrane metalloprotease [Salegentibacter lacus]
MVFVGIINVLFFIAFTIIGIIYSIKHRTRFVELTNFQINKKTLLGFSIMGIVGAAIMFLIFLTNNYLGFIQIESTNEWFSSVKQIPKDFISAFVQEFLFRVAVFIALIYLTGNKLITLILSSIVFCFVHAPTDLISVISYFTAGIMYGLTFLKFKSIWAATGLHFTWNYFQGAIFGFPVSKGISTGLFNLEIDDNWIWNGGEIGPEGSVFGVLCRIMIIIIIFLLSKKYEIKQSVNFLDIKKREW